MITGPVDTPYEHGLFVFDVRLPSDYPASPPLFHYLSQCSGRLNPNLYEDGKVCVSLLGTWAGRGSEVWTSKSNVLQVLVSIQGNFCYLTNTKNFYCSAFHGQNIFPCDLCFILVKKYSLKSAGNSSAQWTTLASVCPSFLGVILNTILVSIRSA